MSSKSHKMGLSALTVFVALNMMGSGIFLLPSSLAKVGSISIFGWIISTVGSIALAVSFSKLSFLCPKEGGLYAYTRDGIGEYAAFTETWCYWLSLWVGNVAIAVAGIGYLAYFVPELSKPMPGAIAAIISIWFFTFLNYPGAGFIGRIQKFTSLGMLIPVVGMAVLGWFFFHPDYITASWIVDKKQSSWDAVMAASSLTLWAFLGLESACIVTGVVENPKKNVPIATMLGTLFAAVIYILSTFAIMGVVPAKELAASSAPFSTAAQYMFGNWAGSFVSFCAVVACLGSLNGWVLTTGQVSKAAADDGMFPKIFADTNKYGTPFKGMIITGVLMTLMGYMTVSPDLASQFQIITLLCVFTNVVPYILATAGIYKIMKDNNIASGEYTRYGLIALLALVYSFYALAGSGKDTVFWGSLTMMLSIPMYGWISHSVKQKRETAAATTVTSENA
ncbi:MAG: putrescine-ornithine antiporter [Paludibacterium sp.]|uniref:putrescine-ornithine antiporter n=1 Tax=Paludibacterium sp. TaxID=1917523 RepID=UPI0025E5965B|nr:putrescine-ornithine antiporter [Paludibacterium sp.]MBV8046742.1 putrescine-ornithine antiporter [Paludibacterium sp.]MBV8648290.1 putrescine-ornithine antiporter [Paludibacterium sp.]